MSTSRFGAVVAAATLACGLAACSSSSKTAAAPASTGRAAPAAHSAPAGTSAAPAPSASAAASGTSGAGDFCTFLGKNNRVLMGIMTGDSRPSGVDKNKLKADLQAEVDQAPSEIKGDLRMIVSLSDSALDGKPVHETSGFVTAMKHYTTWVAAHCPGLSTLPTDAGS